MMRFQNTRGDYLDKVEQLNSMLHPRLRLNYCILFVLLTALRILYRIHNVVFKLQQLFSFSQKKCLLHGSNSRSGQISKFLQSCSSAAVETCWAHNLEVRGSEVLKISLCQ